MRLLAFDFAELGLLLVGSSISREDFAPVFQDVNERRGEAGSGRSEKVEYSKGLSRRCAVGRALTMLKLVN
jgi:hypothetical protein